MKIYTLDKVQDKLIGKIGTRNRDKFEKKLEGYFVRNVKNNDKSGAVQAENKNG